MSVGPLGAVVSAVGPLGAVVSAGWPLGAVVSAGWPLGRLGGERLRGLTRGGRLLGEAPALGTAPGGCALGAAPCGRLLGGVPLLREETEPGPGRDPGDLRDEIDGARAGVR